MEAHIESHLPLITHRVVFSPQTPAPLPIISQRIDFPHFTTNHERSPSPDALWRVTPHRTVKFSKLVDSDMDIDSLSDLTDLSDVESVGGRMEVGKTNLLDLKGVGERKEAGKTKTPGNEDDNCIIKKPDGEVGRSKRSGGYRLQDVLKWNDDIFKAVQTSVQVAASKHLDLKKSYKFQDKRKVKIVCISAQKDYGFLKEYENDWPVLDMLKLHLKTRSEASRKRMEKKSS